MAFDMFLVLPSTTSSGMKVTAEPPLDKYFTTFTNQGVIEIRSFSLDVENPMSISSTTAGAGAGKAKLNPAVIEKSVDLLSESLFKICATGSHLDKMQVFVRKVGGTTVTKPYLVYGFDMVFINKVEWSASEGDDLPIERVEFAYGGLALAYYAQKPDGTFASTSAARTTWSQVTNTEQLTQGVDVFTGV